MVKKIRWYPELSTNIIYWSIAFITLFLSFIFSLEAASFHWKSLVFLLLFFISWRATRRRFLIVTEDGIIITYALLRKQKVISYTSIKEMSMKNNQLSILLKNEKVLDLHIKKKDTDDFKEAVNAFVPDSLPILYKA
ncbi:MAG TPA: EbsA family protein [Candidatus Tetragenococcus pullicola]|nr:EbsA family protein [Candidatus Tetragenococcus pullicola]